MPKQQSFLEQKIEAALGDVYELRKVMEEGHIQSNSCHKATVRILKELVEEVTKELLFLEEDGKILVNQRLVDKAKELGINLK